MCLIKLGLCVYESVHVCHCFCTLFYCRGWTYLIYIPSLIMARISTGCSIKPSADGNCTGLQFSHYRVLLDVVPVLLVICFFSPATPHHYKLLPLHRNTINSRETKAAVISHNNGDGQSRLVCEISQVSIIVQTQ